MKILAIRGNNLASLEGEFEIDFTCEPLKSAGIFAITGSTGSGKSTLLDTLCLALFDDTPRTNKAGENIYITDVNTKTINQRDSRTILRRGTAEGYAQVDFIALNGEKYRSTWFVKRARSKIDGSLQNSEVRLLNLEDNSEFPGRKTETLNRISELIGLTFTQFTRAVLLAQGDFANFLKAKQAEKAELLEKLTGTEIYSRISMSIYEKCKQAEQKLIAIKDKIKDIPLLSQEDREKLQEEKSKVETNLTVLQKELFLIHEKIKWIETEKNLKEEINNAENTLNIIEEELIQAQPRFEYIRKMESAQEIRDTFQSHIQVDIQLSQNKKIVEKQQNILAKQEEELVKSRTLHSQYLEEQNTLQQAYEKAEPEINRARELEIKLGNAKTNSEEIQKEYHRICSTNEKIEKNILILNEDIQKKHTLCEEINNWFANYKGYETIVAKIDFIISLINDIESTDQLILNGKKALENNEAVLKDQLNRLNEIQHEAERLNKMLPKEIAALRGKLEEGSPCPVCGSLHHPFKGMKGDNSMDEEELERAKKNIEHLLKSQAETIEKSKNEITRLNTLIESYIKHQQTSKEKLDTDLIVLSSWKEIQPEVLRERLLNFTRQWNKHSENLKNTEEEIKNLQAQLLSETKIKQELEERLIIQNDKVEKCNSLVSQLASERKQIFNGRPAEEIITSYNQKNQLVLNKLKLLIEEIDKVQSLIGNTKGRINQLTKDIDGLSQYKVKLHTEINEWLNKKEGIYSVELLTELFAKDVAWIAEEKKMLTSLQDKKTSIIATLQERRTVLEKHILSPYRPDEEEKDITLLQKNLTEQETVSKEKQKRYTEIELIFTNHEKGKERLKLYEKEYEQQSTLTDNWKKLNELFGSANGSKFKEIAQGYTLDTLLKYANQHLFNLSKRYTLERIGNTLALQVVDMDMLGEVRAVHSLSGGETFLISLALALGLSSLSSNRMNIESLFIDEGFGSLDIETLNIAMDALDKLRTQGRKIGVISHVAEMTERITTQIKVIKLANGRSMVKVTNKG